MIKFFSGLSCLCCFILFSCKDNVVTPSLLVRDISIQENNDTQTINVVVSLSETSERDVKFHFSTMANTATKGKDYLDKQGDITIAAGSKTASFSLQVLGDTLRFRLLMDTIRPKLEKAIALCGLMNLMEVP